MQTKEHQIKNLFIVNELTLILFIYFSLNNKSPIVVNVEPFLGIFKTPIEYIVKWAEKKEYATPITHVIPELLRPKELWACIALYDVYEKVEPHIQEYYNFEDICKNDPNYGYAVLNIISNRCSWKLHTLLNLISAEKLFQSIKIFGLENDFKYALRIPVTSPKPWTLMHTSISFIILAVSLIFGLFYLTRRTVLYDFEPEPLFLAIDNVGDDQVKSLAERAKNYGRVLLVNRSNKVTSDHLFEDSTTRGEGRFTFSQSIGCAKKYIIDSISLFKKYYHFDHLLFLRIINLANKSIIFRAFVNKYRPQYFWARDLYNAEHIIRDQIFKNYNIKHWSVMHGYPSYSHAFPIYQYISFDRIYLLGEKPYQLHYKKTWPEKVEVVASAGLNIPASLFGNLVKQRVPDILIMCSTYVGEEGLPDFVRGISCAFPQKTIYLQIKKQARNTTHAKKLLTQVSNIKNLIIVEKTIYQIFDKVGFVISDPSTALFEAMQCGLPSLVMDISTTDNTRFFDGHDWLRVKSVASAAERIRSYDNGDDTYSFDCLDNLVYKPAETFENRLLRDMGISDSLSGED